MVHDFQWIKNLSTFKKINMQKIKNKIGNEVLIFAKTFEYEALEQVKRMTNFGPYQTSKVRIMPDAHAGKGCTVGTTMTIRKDFT